jgi:hypothetical protein
LNCVTIAPNVIRKSNSIISDQLASKRDPDLEAEVLAWIETILGEALPKGNYEDILKDGVVLCQ